MEWKDISKRYSLSHRADPYEDCFIAADIIQQAYKDGQILAKVRDLALEKVTTVLHGTWMYEHFKDI